VRKAALGIRKRPGRHGGREDVISAGFDLVQR